VSGISTAETGTAIEAKMIAAVRTCGRSHPESVFTVYSFVEDVTGHFLTL
jgi:hypothetical protein